jgi:excisionase family DNA binding protein
MDIEKILSVSDVADILQVKPITVREMFREKRLRAFKVGKSWRTTRRMLEEDIEALSRGEAPPALPPPPQNLSKHDDDREETGSRAQQEAPAPVQPEVPVAPPAPAPAVQQPPPPAPETDAPEDAAPKQPRKPRKPANGDDDSQGLLF